MKRKRPELIPDNLRNPVNRITVNVGDKFNYLEAVTTDYLCRDYKSIRYCDCRCICGSIRSYQVDNLRRRGVKSCGCRTARLQMRVGTLLDEQGRKRCSRCLQFKVASDYYSTPATPDSYFRWCKECCRRAAYRRMYGIEFAEYERLLEQQNSRCACCQRHVDDLTRTQKRKCRPLFLDHCHATGKVRGLLCVKCNTMIGWLNDNPNLCRSIGESMARYLEENGNENPTKHD